MAVTNVWLVPVTISIAVVVLMHYRSGELTDPPEVMGQMIFHSSFWGELTERHWREHQSLCLNMGHPLDPKRNGRKRLGGITGKRGPVTSRKRPVKWRMISVFIRPHSNHFSFFNVAPYAHIQTAFHSYTSCSSPSGRLHRWSLKLKIDPEGTSM